MRIFSFGLFGAHHFYLRRFSFGVIYLCTLGLCGVGWLVDIFRVPFLAARSASSRRNGRPESVLSQVQKRVDDAYLLAFPLGFLGIHRCYLGQPLFGFLYALELTCGHGLFCHRVAAGPVETATYGERLQLEAGTELDVQNASPLSRI